MFVEESYVTERGRERKRLVPIDIDAVRRELNVPNTAEREVWLQARALMLDRAGGSVFEVWLSAIELVAVDREGLLVLAGPEAMSSWVQARFGRFMSDCCEESGCRVRFASPRERVAIQDRPSDACRQPTMNRRVS